MPALGLNTITAIEFGSAAGVFFGTETNMQFSVLTPLAWPHDGGIRMLVIALLVVVLAPARAEIPRKIADIIRAEAERVGLDPALLEHTTWRGFTPIARSKRRLESLPCWPAQARQAKVKFNKS